jgi:hypothetical protein
MILQNKKTGRYYNLSLAAWNEMSRIEQKKYKQIAEEEFKKGQIEPPQEIKTKMATRETQIIEVYPPEPTKPTKAQNARKEKPNNQ